MRRQTLRIIVPLVAIVAAGSGAAQITGNPIPAPVEKRGLAVEIADLVRLPDTRGIRPADQDVSPAGWARVSYVRDLPDGRRYANDSRGLLYLIDSSNQPHVYANVAEAFPFAVYNRLESGFIGFVFHPEFARNGLFYTVHAERGTGNPKTPDFIPPARGGRDHHNIITEWHATNPSAAFAGTGASCCARPRRRQPDPSMERVQSVVKPEMGYGLLYTSATITDSAMAVDRTRATLQTQRLDSIITAICDDPQVLSHQG